MSIPERYGDAHIPATKEQLEANGGKFATMAEFEANGGKYPTIKQEATLDDSKIEEQPDPQRDIVRRN